jgi:hypothetical protein
MRPEQDPEAFEMMVTQITLAVEAVIRSTIFS